MISVSCSCGRRFKAEDYHAGKRTRCPVCGSLLIIGQGTTPASVNDNGEIPSWWFPTARGTGAGAKEGARPKAQPPTEGVRPKVQPPTDADPDEIRTVILPRTTTSNADVPRTRSSDSSPRSGWAAGRWFLLGLVGSALTLGLAGYFLLFTDPAPREQEKMEPIPPPSPLAQGNTGPISPQPPPLTQAEPVKPSTEAVADVKPRALVASVTPRSTPFPLHLLVPAYFYPAGDGLKAWQRLIATGGKADVVTIANPNNGAGQQRNADYFSIIQEASDKGLHVIGYVSTNYAQRPLGEVTGEIDRWIDLYPKISGFFFDQQSTSRQNLDYYLKIRDHTRSKIRNALIVTNPGTICDPEYFVQGVSDVTCVFANFRGFNELQLPDAVAQLDPARFAALVYDIPTESSMQATIDNARQKHIGYVYIGDSPQGRNPYESLPSYWEQLVQTVAKSERTATPTPSKTPK